MQAHFTIDVEDYFHTVEGEHVPKLAQWDALPTRVEKKLKSFWISWMNTK